MKVEVTTAGRFIGDVMGDLNSRRGQIEGMEPRGNAQVVRAHVPLAEMFGYATDLRSMTQGRATLLDGVRALRSQSRDEHRPTSIARAKRAHG